MKTISKPLNFAAIDIKNHKENTQERDSGKNCKYNQKTICSVIIHNNLLE